MARGWESKSIESQLEDRGNVRKPPKRALTAEERTRAQEVQGLEMSRTSLERELSRTTAPARRSALEDALNHVSDAIKRLTDPNPGT
jgi:hypothetical protein